MSIVSLGLGDPSLVNLAVERWRWCARVRGTGWNQALGAREKESLLLLLFSFFPLCLLLVFLLFLIIIFLPLLLLLKDWEQAACPSSYRGSSRPRCRRRWSRAAWYRSPGPRRTRACAPGSRPPLAGVQTALRPRASCVACRGGGGHLLCSQD